MTYPETVSLNSAGARESARRRNVSDAVSETVHLRCPECDRKLVSAERHRVTSRRYERKCQGCKTSWEVTLDAGPATYGGTQWSERTNTRRKNDGKDRA